MNQENYKTDEWSEIQEITMEKRPISPFPVFCLPSVMGEYVRAVAEFTQTSVDMASVVALGTLATCNQKKFVVYDDYVEPLNLYTVFVAEPGERKSQIVHCFTKYLKEYQVSENKKRAEEIRQYKVKSEMLEQEIKQLKEKKKDKPMDLEEQVLEKTRQLEELEEVVPLRLFCDDCSPEALISLLSRNKGIMSVISAEGGIFDIMNGRYNKSTNLDVFLKGHSGDEIMVDRKGSESIAVFDPALSFVLAIQPDLLREIMASETMAGRGLLARFLYSVPISTVGSRNYKGTPIPKETSDRFQELIFLLLRVEVPEEPVQLLICPEGKERLEKYFYFIERLLGEEPTLRNWLAKHVGCVRRIAGNLHLASEERVTQYISLQTIENSIEIGKYFFFHAKYAFTALQADKENACLKEVLSHIVNLSANYVVKRREVMRHVGKHIAHKIEELLPYLELLEEYGYIKQVHMKVNPSHKKPSDLIFLNPAYRP